MSREEPQQYVVTANNCRYGVTHAYIFWAETAYEACCQAMQEVFGFQLTVGLTVSSKSGWDWMIGEWYFKAENVVEESNE